MRSDWLIVLSSCALLAAGARAAPAADGRSTGGEAAAARSCEAALQALSAAEEEALAQRARPRARGEAGAAAGADTIGPAEVAPAAVLQARRAAARACLRSEEAVPPRGARIPPVPGGTAQPTATRPSAAGAAPGGTAAPGTPVRTEPLKRPTPPVTITACDPTGCWASDGTRLQRTGPQQLLGPRGPCVPQGPFLSCP